MCSEDCLNGRLQRVRLLKTMGTFKQPTLKLHRILLYRAIRFNWTVISLFSLSLFYCCDIPAIVKQDKRTGSAGAQLPVIMIVLLSTVRCMGDQLTLSPCNAKYIHGDKYIIADNSRTYTETDNREGKRPGCTAIPFLLRLPRPNVTTIVPRCKA